MYCAIIKIYSYVLCPPVPALESLSIRISRWESTLVDWGQGVPKGSHHATDLTQEIYWGVKFASEWGVVRGSCYGGNLTKGGDSENISYLVADNYLSAGIECQKVDYGITWPLRLSYRKCLQKSGYGSPKSSPNCSHNP